MRDPHVERLPSGVDALAYGVCVPPQKRSAQIEPKRTTRAEPKRTTRAEPKRTARAGPKRTARAEPTTITDPRAITALAHPARLAVLEELRVRDELTATECAQL